MFHFDLCCHLCRSKSYFVWHEWDIFCLIKFKLCYCCSVQFWFACALCDAISLLMVDCFFSVGVAVVAWVSVSVQRFCRFLCVFLSPPPCLLLHSRVDLVLWKCASQVQTTQNVRVMPMQTQDSYKLYRQNHKRNILPFVSNVDVLVMYCWNITAGDRDEEMIFSHYYSLSNLIELLWYITFRTVIKTVENDKLHSDSSS